MPIAYKLLREKNGVLYPLYVLANIPTPIGQWISAQDGPAANTPDHVKSRLGDLAFRPGWHLSPLPLATHIGVKDASGKIVAMHPDTVWCECEYHDTICYQSEADSNGWKNGRFDKRRAMLRHIPENGYYHYKTNPKMFMDWIIVGEMKIVRVLSDDDVAKICLAAGVTPLPRSKAM